MLPRTRTILENAIDRGIKNGLVRSRKHTDKPNESYVIDCIEQAIWLEIDELFNFEEE